MSKRIAVVGAVIREGDHVLAALRSESMSQPGLWEFPGGKIEPGETPRACLRREIREELMCDVDVGAHLETTAHPYAFGVVELTTYWCTLRPGDEPRPIEHAEVRWVRIHDLPSLEWAPADIPAVERIVGEFAEQTA